MLVEPVRRSIIESVHGTLSAFITFNHKSIMRQPSTGYKELYFPLWSEARTGLEFQEYSVNFWQVWAEWLEQAEYPLTFTACSTAPEPLMLQRLRTFSMRRPTDTNIGHVFVSYVEDTNLFSDDFDIFLVTRTTADKLVNVPGRFVYLGPGGIKSGDYFAAHYGYSEMCSACAYNQEDGYCLAWPFESMRSTVFQPIFNSWFMLSCLYRKACPYYTKGGDYNVPGIYRQWELGACRIPSDTRRLSQKYAELGEIIQCDMQELQRDGESLARPVCPPTALRLLNTKTRRKAKTRTRTASSRTHKP